MIVDYEDRWREPVAHLWARSFQGRNEELNLTWAWLYDHALRTPASPPLLLFVDPPRVLGMLGTLPATVRRPGGKLVHGSYGVDVLVDPEFRHAGIGGYLIQAWDARTPLALSLGVSAEALPVFLSSGRRLVGDVPLFKRVVDGSVVASQRLGSALVGKMVGPMVDLALKARRRRASTGPRAFKRLSLRDPAIDRLWERVAAAHPWACVRDSAWLSWRFADTPMGPFDAFGTWEGEQLVAYVVTTQFRRGTMLVGCLADFLAEDDEELRAYTLQRGSEHLATQRVALIESFASHPGYGRALQASGYSHRESGVHFLVKSPGEPEAAATSMADWHITYADADCLTVPQREAALERDHL